jgi:hypothetical protein
VLTGISGAFPRSISRWRCSTQSPPIPRQDEPKTKTKDKIQDKKIKRYKIDHKDQKDLEKDQKDLEKDQKDSKRSTSLDLRVNSEKSDE